MPYSVGRARWASPVGPGRAKRDSREKGSYNAPALTKESAMLENSLSEDRRKDIFRALVEAQDGGASVAESRDQVAQQFGVSEQEVRRIEREGLDKGWPPL
jgi:hypothetical protein